MSEMSRPRCTAPAAGDRGNLATDAERAASVFLFSEAVIAEGLHVRIAPLMLLTVRAAYIEAAFVCGRVETTIP